MLEDSVSFKSFCASEVDVSVESPRTNIQTSHWVLLVPAGTELSWSSLLEYWTFVWLEQQLLHHRGFNVCVHSPSTWTVLRLWSFFILMCHRPWVQQHVTECCPVPIWSSDSAGPRCVSGLQGQQRTDSPVSLCHGGRRPLLLRAAAAGPRHHRYGGSQSQSSCYTQTQTDAHTSITLPI